MKRTDIEAGVVYAYRTSRLGPADMVAVLDPGNLYWFGPGRHFGASERVLSLAGPTDKVGRNVGLLGVTRARRGAREGLEQRLLQVSTELALASQKWDIESLNVSLTPLNPRYLLATWEQYAELEHRETIRQEEERRESQLRADLRREMMTRRLELLKQFPDLGSVQTSEARGTITLTLAQIDVLLK